MQQTGFDVNARAASAATANANEIQGAVVARTLAPISTAVAILTQSARVFDRALFSNQKQLEQRSTSKETRSSQSADGTLSAGVADALGTTSDGHNRIERRESRQDKSGGESGNRERSEKNDKTNENATELHAENSKAGPNSSAGLQKLSAKPEEASKKEPVPERLEKVVAEVTEAMTELSSAGKQARKKTPEEELAAFSVGFTLVEQDDEDPKFRRFLMFAEDDDLMEEPWSIRFNDEEIYLEIHARDPKLVPMMMEHVAEMETDFQARLGVKVVVSFKTFSKGQIL